MSYEPPVLEVQINNIVVKTIGRYYYKAFAEALNLKGDEVVLDYGSGAGGLAYYISKALKKRGTLTCVDISQRWMKLIKKRLAKCNNAIFKLGDITKLDLPDYYFDIIIVHFVIHDIPVGEQEKIINILFKVLKKGGQVILREPIEHEPEKILELFQKSGFIISAKDRVKVPVKTEAVDVRLSKL